MEVLQAIVVGESLGGKLEPVTLECPEVLVRLGNTPMIENTLAWLECAKVEQVFVLCGSQAKQIREHIDNSKWGKNQKMSVTTIECKNAGDGLRYIQKLNVIGGDFILVSGDVVSNMKLTQAFEEHKERKEKDGNVVMTMVIKESESDESIIMAMDPTTKQLLQYEDKTHDVKFNNSYLDVNPLFSFHNDKQDCYIDICSPQILGLFTDIDDQRRFVKRLLVDDVTCFKIFTHEIDSSCYAARVDSFERYDSISKDIIQGRFVPINYNPAAKVSPGKGTVISDSVIGEGCKIGCNVVIDGCYIWNNVTIEDGCRLWESIVCDGAVMKSRAVLEQGVVLCNKVVVGPRKVVRSLSKVSLLRPQPDRDYADEFWSLGHDGWSHAKESFEKEVENIFLRAVAVGEEATIYHILCRVNTLRFAFDVDMEECDTALLYSVMKVALDTSSKHDLVKETDDVISKWGDLIKGFAPDMLGTIKMILRLEEMCLESLKEYAPLFVEILKIFYHRNVFQKEAILNWAKHKEQHVDQSDNVFVKQSQKFLQWLEQK